MSVEFPGCPQKERTANVDVLGPKKKDSSSLPFFSEGEASKGISTGLQELQQVRIPSIVSLTTIERTSKVTARKWQQELRTAEKDRSEQEANSAEKELTGQLLTLGSRPKNWRKRTVLAPFQSLPFLLDSQLAKEYLSQLRQLKTFKNLGLAWSY